MRILYPHLVYGAISSSGSYYAPTYLPLIISTFNRRHPCLPLQLGIHGGNPKRCRPQMLEPPREDHRDGGFITPDTTDERRGEEYLRSEQFGA